MTAPEARDSVTDVSVIIPTFRRPAMLVEAVQSALAQEGVSVEVIVIDDSPEASGREAVSQICDPRVSYRSSKTPTGGPSRVRNEGWLNARGRFLHFLDDDDRVLPGAYRDAVAAFSANPDVGVLYGRIEPFGDDPAALARERRVFARAARRSRVYARVGSRLLIVANQLYSGSSLHVNSGCMIRRHIVAKLGGYDEEMRVVEDLDFYIRAIRAYGCVFIDRPLVEYRTGMPSLMTTAIADAKVGTAYRRIYQKYRAEYGALELGVLKVLAKGVLRWL